MENSQIKELQASDFVLMDAMEFTQEQIEKWIEECEKLAGDKDVLALKTQVYRRVVAEAALAAGWFSAVPEGFKSDMATRLRPRVISELGDAIVRHYNLIYEPDENFTEPQ